MEFRPAFCQRPAPLPPRLPKSGYYHIAGEVPPTAAGGPHGYDRFRFNADEIRPTFKNLDDIETLCFSHWFMSRLKIASIDDAGHIVTFTGTTRMTAYFGRLHQGW